MTHDLLLTKAEDIGRSIAKSECARQFWQAREKMAQNPQAQSLFEDLKLKTNNKLGLIQAVGTSHPKLKELDAEIQSIETKLYEIPVAMQYKDAQDELNSIMQDLMSVLMDRLAPELPVEFGPREGCGKGPDGNGCNCGERD
ncbi:YlbF family regulator [Alicyclobacillus curvatus]|nr:YlbF family regulator [Alicyclobacillus curvatus]